MFTWLISLCYSETTDNSPLINEVLRHTNVLWQNAPKRQETVEDIPTSSSSVR